MRVQRERSRARPAGPNKSTGQRPFHRAPRVLAPQLRGALRLMRLAGHLQASLEIRSCSRSIPRAERPPQRPATGVRTTPATVRALEAEAGVASPRTKPAP